MSALQHVQFVVFVAIASYVQNLTGFAFALVLLGLVGLVQLAPLSDVANVVSVLSLFNAALLLRSGARRIDRSILVPTLAASLVGVYVGVWLLNWLSDNVMLGLRMALGMTIVASAILLVVRTKELKHFSSRVHFAATGLVSGVLGGLFSAAGPPLVYHFYRQPMQAIDIRIALTLIFAANAATRLILQAGSGRIGVQSLWMSLEAAPVVLLMTMMVVRRPTRWSVTTIRRAVGALLAVVGLALFVPSMRQLLQAVA
jgi:uncharacterized membrane protein YfcA